MQLRVLLLVRDAKLRRRIAALLKETDAFVRSLSSEQASWDLASQVLADVVIVEEPLIPEPASTHVQALKEQATAPALVILSAADSAEESSVLRAAGSEATLYTHAEDGVLGQAIARIAEERRELLARTVAARRATPRPELSDFVSTSEVMQRFMGTVRRVTDSDAPLLVTGETGVGKERLARAVHFDSRRSDGPFISVNCGAIPENLLESQLFGHEKGAFTGAARTQRGCFELAHDGTLFLDEIGEMPLHLQVKLLHVLQDYEVAPVGGERKIPVDVRVIAATNRDIKQEVEDGRFRRDLFYRLGVITLHVPPLRERRGDISSLSRSILDGLNARIGRTVSSISPTAMEALIEYEWPGNVRELINVLERAVLLCGGDVIAVADLPEDVAGVGRVAMTRGGADAGCFLADGWPERPLKDVTAEAVEQIEKTYLSRLLSETNGRVGETAQRACIEPRSLFNKMKRYGLRKEDFRSR